MNTQINLRLPGKMVDTAQEYADKHGFASIQELIKELMRERLFEEPGMSKKELALIRKLVAVTEKQGLYGTEEELFKKLKRR